MDATVGKKRRSVLLLDEYTIRGIHYKRLHKHPKYSFEDHVFFMLKRVYPGLNAPVIAGGGGVSDVYICRC